MESSSEQSASRKSIYLSAQKVSIAAVVAFLFLLFGAIVVFASHFSGSGEPSPSPSGQPDGLFQAGEASALQAAQQQQPQVKGANTKQSADNYNVPQPEKSAPPTPKPTASAKPSSTPAPTAEPTPSPSPSPTNSPTPESTPAPSPLSVSCSAEPNEVDKGGEIQWKATASGGNNNFSYNWSGTNDLSGSNQNVSKTYSESGLKQASVKVSSAGSEVTSTCQATVKNVP